LKKETGMAADTVTPSKIRWGILGTAEIARKNWKAIQLSGNSTVAAVASRDVERSRRFVVECQTEAPMEVVPDTFGSYEELLACEEVDAIYMPLPTAIRKQWVVRAADAGKHVVCEKPCATSVGDLEEMLAACRHNGVQFMDGVMLTHSRRAESLRKILDEGESVGRLRRIVSAFSFSGSTEFQATNIRMHSELEPDGCVGDLGWYCIRLTLWVMNWQMPVEVSGRILSQGSCPHSPGAVPTEFSGELLFADGVSAGFYCSFVTELQQWAIIGGTRGYVDMADFVLPFAGKELTFEIRKSAFQTRGCDFRMQTDARTIVVPEWSHGHATAHEANCFRNFADEIRAGHLNDTWPEAALKTQMVMCACLDSARADGRMVRL